MKETLCVRLEYELIERLGIDKASNKSDYLREILREYLKLKEKESTYLGIEEELRNLKRELKQVKDSLPNEDLNRIKTLLEDIKTSIGKYEVKGKTIPVSRIVEKTYWGVKDLEETQNKFFLYTLIGILVLILLQVLGFVLFHLK